MNDDYNAKCMDIVQDYIHYLNRDRLVKYCQTLATFYGMDDTEVINDVDALYIAEFGDLY